MSVGIVLVHGFSGSPDTLSLLAGKLAAEYGQDAVTSVCLPGHPAPWHPPAPAGGGKRLPAREDARVISSGRSRYSGEPPAPAGGGSTERIVFTRPTAPLSRRTLIPWG